jgi:hypothetical protein
VRAALAAHGELGASDLAAALAFAAGADRVLVVGDAVATAGTRDPIETAHAAGIGRIDVVVPPRARSRRDAAALADAGARPGRVLHAQAVGAMDGLDVSATGRLGLTVTDARRGLAERDHQRRAGDPSGVQRRPPRGATSRCASVTARS